MVTRKNDEAVSPVIGVILMVAITVILAAVIAAFVFGMSGNISKTKVVASTVTQADANRITITYNGGQDDPTLQSISVTAPNGTIWNSTVASGSAVLAQSPGTKPAVGASFTLFKPAADDWAGQNHVVVVGVFSDGGNQVIADTYV